MLDNLPTDWRDYHIGEVSSGEITRVGDFLSGSDVPAQFAKIYFDEYWFQGVRRRASEVAIVLK